MIDKATVRGLLGVALLFLISTVSCGQDITYDLVNYRDSGCRVTDFLYWQRSKQTELCL